MEQKPGFTGCCLWSALLSGVGLLLLCCCCSVAFILIAASDVDGSVDFNFMATPTPINTCAGLLENIHQTPGADTNLQLDQRYTLTVYQVTGDQLSDPVNNEVAAELLPMQNDLSNQKLIWEYFTRIIPAAERQTLTEYRIFSDGTGGYNGYYQVRWEWEGDNQSQTGALEIDLADYDGLKSINNALIHEFGHMLTLNIEQLDIRTEPEACPAYATDNCSFADSYLNLFYQQFWAGSTHDEWLAITSQTDETAVKQGLADFYHAHPKEFVREYAATAPKEDLADSWTYFVMTPQPAGKTLAEQKILFFYGFPEFVELRSQIRKNICNYYNLPE